MAIVDPIKNNRDGLKQQFDQALAQRRIPRSTRFTPVVRQVGAPGDNRYVMFCLAPNGHPLRVTESIEFRTAITGRSRVRLVRRDKKRRRWVKTQIYVP